MSQTDPIQALIQDIDEVLQKTTARLPWVMSNENLQQRQVLEQTRAYLADLQLRQEEQSQQEVLQREASQQESPEELQGQVRQAPVSSDSLLPSGQPAAESAQQVLQSVLQEMNYLRVNMLQPMRSDVELLRQQREALTQEIRQLEAQRQHELQHHSNPQFANSQILMEFLQSAMAQMQENLRGQVVQIVASLSASDQSALDQPALDQPLLGGSGLANLAGANLVGGANLAGGIEAIALSPVQRLEQIQRVQSQSDQLLLKLDSTVRVIFESLQGNLQSYQDSLEEGLSRIHNLGQQGEVIVAALVNRLAVQVGREASSYLQSTLSPSNAPSSNSQSSGSSSMGANLSALPAIAPNAENETDTQIARLLEELNALDANLSADNQSAGNQSASNQPDNPSEKPVDAAIDTRWQPQPFTLDATPGSMAALSQELDQLDLSSVPLNLDLLPDDEEPTVFQTNFQADPSSSSLAFNYRGSDRWGNDNERTQLQIGDSSGSAVPSREVEDLESALDLLNQLGVAARAAADAAIAAESVSASGVEPEAESEPTEPEMVKSPENLYEDEFYQTLFGDPSSETEEKQNPAISPEFPSESPSEVHASEPDMAFGDLFSGMPDTDPSIEASSASTPDAPVASEDSISDPLFADFDDPAVNPVQEADAAFLNDFSSLALPQDLPQSMENFLLSADSPPKELEADPAVAIASTENSAEPNSAEPNLAEPASGELAETDLFWDVPPSPESLAVHPNSLDSIPDSLEVIRVLTDLIPNPEAASSLNADRSVELEGFKEDAFEPAEASENLLALETSHALPIAELEIGEDTLQQLAADLSSLEQSPSEQLPGSPKPTSSSSQSSLLLADLFAGEGDRPSEAAARETVEELLFTDDLAPVQPEAASSEPQPSAFAETDAERTDSNTFTLEGVDTLFETFSDGSAAAQPSHNSADQSSASIESVFGDNADSDSSLPKSPSADASTKKKN